MVGGRLAGPVVATVSGGNIDPLLLEHLVTGGLTGLLRVVAEHRGNVVGVTHRRLESRLKVGEVAVVLELETRGSEHVAELIAALGERRRMFDRDRGRLRGAASSRSRGHVDDQRPPGGPGADGPPPPPFVRERKRRRRIGLAIAAALLVIGIPIGLAIVSALAERDDPVAAPMTEDDPEDDAANDDAAGADRDDGQGTDSDEGVADPDAGADPEDGAADAGPDEGADGGPADDPDEGPEPTLRPPDVDALGGLDATYAELLLAIDDSERTMIAFQEEAVEAFADAASPADGVAAVGVVAGVRRVQLLEVRERLVDDLDDAGAEQVRTRYLEHLDSWADYMAAVEEDPALLIEGRGTGFTVVINATADAFSRALESELPADIDVEVERFAEGILDRGFRGFSEAQV